MKKSSDKEIIAIKIQLTNKLNFKYMSINLYVHEVHKVISSESIVCGYDSVYQFIERLENYFAKNEWENGYNGIVCTGEDCFWSNYEVLREELIEVYNNVDIPDEDRKIIKHLIEDSDQENEYIFISCY